MTESIALTAPSLTRKRGWLWPMIGAVASFCLIGGLSFWRTQNSHPRTVTIVARNELTREPISGIQLAIVDTNYGLPIRLPINLHQWNVFYRPSRGTTDQQGKMTLNLPSGGHPDIDARQTIGVFPNTFPPGFDTRWEGHLFHDDEIILWLKPPPGTALKSTSISNSSPPRSDEQILEPLEETP